MTCLKHISKDACIQTNKPELERLHKHKKLMLKTCHVAEISHLAMRSVGSKKNYSK